MGEVNQGLLSNGEKRTALKLMQLLKICSLNSYLAIACLMAMMGLASCSSGERHGLLEPDIQERRFEFRYQVLMPAIPEGATTYRAWIPLPAEMEEQQIHDLKIVSSVRHEQRVDDLYGNRYIYIDRKPGDYPWPVSVTLRFEVTRKESRVDLGAWSASMQTTSNFGEDTHKFLQENRLVPLGGLIEQLSKEVTAGAEDNLDKVRRIYDYVVATMSYDKSGQGWGRGDAVFACTAKRGNCTDFHALFIGMVRAAEIPARFEIGFSLPPQEKQGDIEGYHCWAQFYLQGLGWVPVDASEAWKNPLRKDYFFGGHDEHRVHFTTGRDLVLDEDQQTEPLNYFVYPSVEIDGVVVELLEKRFWFRELAGS